MIIASYIAPKQRCTIHYGYRITENAPFTNETRYTMEKFEVDTQQSLGASYNLTAEQAWSSFHKAIQLNAEYGPGTWEE